MHTRLAAASLVLASLALTGCTGRFGHHEGGNMTSNDRHVYVSYPTQPKTIKVIDVRTGEPFWTHELPVGKKLSIEFHENANDDPNWSATMKWQEVDAKQDLFRYENSIPAPPRGARRVDFELREAPEYAADTGS